MPFGVGSLQRFVPFDVEAHYFTLLEDPDRHAALRTICCFDLLANSADRKGGHCLAGDDGRVWAVDNGLTFHCEPQAAHRHLGLRQRGRARRPAGRRRSGWPTEGGPDALADLLDADGARRPGRAGRSELVADGTFPVDPTGRRYPWPLV